MIAVLALTECGDQRTYMAVTMTPVNTAPILLSDQHGGGDPIGAGARLVHRRIRHGQRR
jgi:hypothetical protein